MSLSGARTLSNHSLRHKSRLSKRLRIRDLKWLLCFEFNGRRFCPWPLRSCCSCVRSAVNRAGEVVCLSFVFNNNLFFLLLFLRRNKRYCASRTRSEVMACTCHLAVPWLVCSGLEEWALSSVSFVSTSTSFCYFKCMYARMFKISRHPPPFPLTRGCSNKDTSRVKRQFFSLTLGLLF